MTRAEFENEVTTWGELFDVCREHDLRTLDDVYDDEAYDDAINNELVERARQDNWYDVYRWLDELPSGEDYYYCGDYDWEVADFDDFKGRVYEDMEYNDCFEEEEEEEEIDEEEIDEEDGDDVQATDEELEINDDEFLGILVRSVEVA